MSEHNSVKRTDRPMSYIRSCLVFSNGNMDRGRQTIFILARRLEEARQKHPVFAEGSEEALDVMEGKFRELRYATERETPNRQRDEALELACTVMRFVNREY